MFNSGKWNKIIFVLLVLAAVSMFSGGFIYYSFEFPENPGASIVMALQNCMESLLFNPILPIQDIYDNKAFINSIGPVEKCIIYFYSLAMVLAPFIDILIIFSVLDSFLHVFVGIGYKKNRILIVGYNDEVKKLLERRNKNGKVYLWTETSLSEEEVRSLYFKRVNVKMNDFSLGDRPEEYLSQKKKFDRFMRGKHITNVLLMDASEVKNMQYYMALSSCDVCKKKTIHFYVHNDSLETRIMLQNYFDGMLSDAIKSKKTPSDDTHMDLKIFNIKQIQAELLFEKMPIWKGVETSNNKNVHMLIVGGNSLSMYVALQAMNQAVLTSDNKILIDIVAEDISDISQRLKARFNSEYVNNSKTNEFEIGSKQSDGLLKIRLSECNLMGDDLKQTLERLQSDAIGGFTYIALCSESETENICVFKHIGDEMLMQETPPVPVVIRMTYAEEMKTFLSSYKWCSDLYFIGENDEYIGLDQIIDSEEETAIRSYNAVYENVSNSRIYEGREASLDDKNINALWNKLEYYKRQSNRALYLHRNVKKAVLSGYETELEHFWDKSNSTEGNRALDLSLRLKSGEYPELLKAAKTEHRRFVYFFASEGWGYGTKKNPKERLHDCLCTWDMLVESRPDTLIYDLISLPSLINTGSK